MVHPVLTDVKKLNNLPLDLDSSRETQVNSFLGITKRKIALLSITAMGAGGVVALSTGWSGIGLIVGVALTLLGLIGAVFSLFFISDLPERALRPRASEDLLLEPPSLGIAEESSSRSVSLFEQEDQKLRDLENRCRELKGRGNEEEVEKLLPELHSLRKRVQELNLEQNGLTSRDLDNIRALFTPPIESSYLDPLYPNKRYVMPNHGDMMVLVGDYFSPDEYEGFTFFRQELRKNPVTGKLQRCDVLHCKKRAVQIRYETGQFGFWDKVWGRESMVQEIQNKQKQKGKELLPKLQGQLATWQYESMHLCSKDDLIENGDSGEVLAARDVILFFHKEIIPSTVHLEEVL